MSSPIHAARCVARDGATVDIELIPTTASWAHFPFSNFFALKVLHEAATTMVMYRGTPLWRLVDNPGGPIGHEVSFDELMDLAFADTPDEQLVRPPTPEQRQALRERKRSLVDRFIAEVIYVAVDHWQPSLCPLESGAYRRPVAASDARRRESERKLQAIFDSADESQRPSATLRIETTAAKWVSHLDVGMDWDVYAFDDGAGLLI